MRRSISAKRASKDAPPPLLPSPPPPPPPWRRPPLGIAPRGPAEWWLPTRRAAAATRSSALAEPLFRLRRRCHAGSPQRCAVVDGTALPAAQRGAEAARPPQWRPLGGGRGARLTTASARSRPGCPRQAAGHAPPLSGGGGSRWALLQAALVGPAPARSTCQPQIEGQGGNPPLANPWPSDVAIPLAPKPSPH